MIAEKASDMILEDARRCIVARMQRKRNPAVYSIRGEASPGLRYAASGLQILPLIPTRNTRFTICSTARRLRRMPADMIDRPQG